MQTEAATNHQQRLEAIQQQLGEMKGEPVKAAAKVKLSYIENILKRAEQQTQGVQQGLLDKAEALVEQWQANLHNNLHFDKTPKRKPSALQALTDRLNQGCYEEIMPTLDSEELDDFLLEQEQDLLDSFMVQKGFDFDDAEPQPPEGEEAIDAEGESGEKAEQVEQTDKPAQNTQQAEPLRELASIKLFRKAIGKVTIDRRVSKAIEEGPENPGPLNPESLSIRSLTLMRDLSPRYLNRYVSYMDTLLWLQQVNTAQQEAKAKAKPASKKRNPK